ncbi:MAG TPA: YggT family protein [Alloiococcus sp.]|nr:YggT family protein [Alloiococcus sp.]
MPQLLITVGQLILQLINVYRWILLIYFLLSWLPGAYQSSFGQMLVKICEPYVGIFRQFIPPIGMISIAGMVAYFSLFFVEQGVIAIINILIRLFA